MVVDLSDPNHAIRDQSRASLPRSLAVYLPKWVDYMDAFETAEVAVACDEFRNAVHQAQSRDIGIMHEVPGDPRPVQHLLHHAGMLRGFR